MILSISIKDTIRFDHAVWLAKQARKHRCDQHDILAAIKPQPAPAAFTPAVAPAVVKAEEVSQAASSATKPQPPSTPAAQAHIVEPTSNPLDERPTSPLGADGAADPATILEPNPAADGSDVASKAETGKSAGEQSSAAPVKKITQRQRVLDCHQANPGWGVPQIAAELEMSKSNVWSIASQIGLKFAGKKAATTEALRKAVKAERAPQEQSPASPTEPTTLKARVADIHREHPDWTAGQIAKHLGSPRGTITAYLFDARASERAVEAATHDRLISDAREREQQRAQIVESVGGTPTLTERVRVLHQQRPNWTARMIANELGAPPNSVRTLLSTIRGEATPSEVDQPMFVGKAALQQHYGDVSKRLGKPS